MALSNLQELKQYQRGNREELPTPGSLSISSIPCVVLKLQLISHISLLFCVSDIDRLC